VLRTVQFARGETDEGLDVAAPVVVEGELVLIRHPARGQFPAVVEAEKLTGPRTPPPTLYNLACVWSVCGDAVLADGRLPRAERLARSGAFTANGLALLRRAGAGGHFRDPSNRQLLKTDPDLTLLREQRGFQDLLKSVEGRKE